REGDGQKIGGAGPGRGLRRLLAGRYSAFIASTEMSTFTSSPTAGANLPRLKSERFSVVVGSNPTQGLPAIGCWPILFRVAYSTTGLVTPLMVRSPVIFAVFSPVTSTLVLLKLTLGLTSALKKSALSR